MINKKRIAFLVDSSFSIPDNEQNSAISEHIYYVPLIIIDPEGNEYKDEKISMSSDKLAEVFKNFPNKGLTTSITPKVVLETKLKELFKKYDYVIGLPVAKALSNQFNLFLNTSKDKEFENRFFVVGELNLSFISYELIKCILFQLNQLTSIDHNILKNVLSKIEQSYIATAFIIVTNLDRLYLSGRISKTRLRIANMANIKVSLDMEKTGLVKLKTGRSLYKLFDDSINATIEKHGINLKKTKAYLVPFKVETADIDKLLLISKDYFKNVYYDGKITIPTIIATHLSLNSVGLLLIQEMRN